MKRLRVVEILEATEGGTRTHLRHLLAGLDPARFARFALVSTRRTPHFLRDMAELSARGVRFRDVGMVKYPRPAADLAALARIVSALKGLRPDVVHTHGSKGGVLGRLAAGLVKVPLVIHTPHVYPFQWTGGAQARFYREVERLACRLAHRVVLFGPRQEEIARAAGVLRPGQCAIIENGVEPAEFAFSRRDRAAARKDLGLSERDLAVGMVARLVPQKGVGQFVRAAAIVREREPRTVFLLIGGGPLTEEVRARADSLGMDPAVFRLLDHREDAAGLYAAFDLFCLSSLWEGMPYVALEAMAAGLAVVATRIPGILDTVAEGRTGLLADLDEPREIAERILALLGDADRRREMGEAGRELVRERFTLQRFIERHAALYEGRLPP